MLDAVLHAGTEQTAGGWILVASLLSFIAGLGLGLSSDRLLARLGREPSEPVDDPSN